MGFELESLLIFSVLALIGEPPYDPPASFAGGSEVWCR